VVNQSVWFWVLMGYLCGSVPFGLLLGLAQGVDIRQSGSGNIGATNALRVLGRKTGVVCFGLDVLKGLVPVLTASWAMGYIGGPHNQGQAWEWLVVATSPIVGHIYPVWLRFKGGKGVATGLGAMLGVWPALTWPGLCAIVVWAVTVGVWRYVSLASVVSAVSVPLVVAITVLGFGQRWADAVPFVIMTSLLAGLVIVRHWNNLGRIRAGSEPKIGQRKNRGGQDSIQSPVIVKRPSE